MGTILEIVVDEINLEKELIVTPTGQFENLEYVTVVLYEPPSAESEGNS